MYCKFHIVINRYKLSSFERTPFLDLYYLKCGIADEAVLARPQLFEGGCCWK